MKASFALAAPLALLLTACPPPERDFTTGGAGAGGSGGSGGAGGGESCPAGFANCDENPDCETKVTDNPNACGGCGVVCKSTCVGTTCNDVTHIAAGYNHTCAITATGDLYCWGDNKYGEIGIGFSMGEAVTTPQKVATSGPVKSVSLGGALVDSPVGFAHTCAIITDGTAQCWGSNSYGELGIGSAGGQGTPSTVVSFVKGREVSVGGVHSCALTETDELYCWGSNGSGQLGLGAAMDKDAPTLVMGGVKVLSSGRDHTCIVNTTGDLYCWGRNQWGRLGIGNQMNQNAPVLVSLPGVEQVSAGGEHTCARVKGGEVFCWGNGYQGQLGIPNEFTWREKPSDPFAAPSPSLWVAAGGQHTVSISGSGNEVFVSSTTIPIGNGGATGSEAPISSTVADAVEIAVGDSHTCVLTKDKRVLCWGDNTHGQLGNDKASASSAVPFQVYFP